MSNPVVLITGALTGIGRAAAVAFAKKGANVVVAGRRDEAGKALVKELRSFGSEAEFINADVRKEDDVRALVDKTVARFGRIDAAVNAATPKGSLDRSLSKLPKATQPTSTPMCLARCSA
jgi:NAD(P)-dependent dehydrogenase (short-subunit alcohol dehydrogenase family)